MSDVRYLQLTDPSQFSTVQLDFMLTPTLLVDDAASLQSAMIVALGTDALAGANDVLPDLDGTDRRGWWGDMDAEEIWGGWPVGCKLWLLSRTKITGALATEGGTVARADAYCRDALRPFVDQRIATTYNVVAERTDVGRIDVDVVLFRGREPAVALRYSDLWDELGAP